VVAVQVHPPPVVTSTAYAPPLDPIDVLLGLKPTAHDGPLWLTLNVLPPIVIDPVRMVNPGFAAIV
jgi:hypothetical protein